MTKEGLILLTDDENMFLIILFFYFLGWSNFHYLVYFENDSTKRLISNGDSNSSGILRTLPSRVSGLM